MTVQWKTAADGDGDHPATSGTDYTAVSTAQTATIAAGASSVEVEVQTTEDSVDEEDETFLVTLSAPTNATLDATASTGTGTITDDDSATAVVSVGAATAVTEGDAPATTVDLSFPVTLSAATGKDVTVTYSVGGTAAAPGDYIDPETKSVVIDAGELTGSIVIQVKGDVVDELDETVTVTLTGATNAVLHSTEASLTGSGTINDDDAAKLSIGDATADEGDKATFTITLSPISDRPVTVQWKTAADGDGDHPATSGTDYTAVSTAQTATIAAGASSVEVEVQTTEDSVDEEDETFLVTLSAPTNATLDATASTGTGTITDDDSATAVVSVGAATAVTEGDAPATTVDLSFPVTLSAATGKDVTVTYSVGGTAAAPGDYIDPETKSVVIDAGELTGSIVIQVKGDVVDELDETVTVTLTGATNAVLHSTEASLTGSGTINDDDAAKLSIGDATADEGDKATFTITLSPISDRPVTVQWKTAADGDGDHPATSGTDYTAVSTAQTATIAAGASSVEVEVQTTEDSVDEEDETFLVTLSAPTNATLDATASTGTGTITDDDSATAVVSVGAATAVTEGDAPATTVDLSFPVTLSAATGKDVTVTYSVGGTAAAPGDYIDPETKSVVIDAGELTGSIVIQVKGDVVDELDETVTVTLTGATNAVLHSTEASLTGSGTINDDDAAKLSIGDATADEGDKATFTITLSPISDRPVTVQWKTAADGDGDHPATSGTDYTAVSTAQTATIAAGASSVEVEVQTTEDSVDEEDETFLVTLSAPTNATLDATASTGTGTITDDDSATAVVSVGAATAVTEGDAPATTVDLSFPVTLSAATGKDVTVTYSVGGTAAAPGDYIDPETKSVVIDAGELTGSIVIQVKGDVVDELDETVTVTLTGATNAVLHSTEASLTGSGTINDDDAAKLSIGDATADEGDKATFTITLSPISDRPVTVQWKTAADGDGDHPATSGTDYTAVSTAQTATIAAGASSVEVEVQTTEDSVDEEDETFLVTLSSPVNAALGTKSTATARIVDNDGVNLKKNVITLLPDTPTSVSEGVITAPTVRFTISLAETTYSTPQTITVSVGKAGDSAVSGVDYTAVSNFDVTLPAEASSVQGSFTLDPIDDALDEDDETLTISASLAGIEITDLLFTITDNDPEPSVSIAAATAVTEGDVPATTVDMSFPVSLSAVSGRDVTVTYSLGGTATADDDYIDPTTKSITIAAGAQTANIVIQVKGDVVDELDETITVTLTGATNAALSSTATDLTASGTITDDDAAQLSIGDATADEGDKAAFTITLSPISDRPVTVKWATAADATGDHPATSGTDYTAVSTAETATIAAGASSVQVEVQTTEDSVDEEDETFLVVLSAPTNATLDATASTGTGTITDDDGATVVSLSVSPASVAENVQTAPTMTVTATVDGTSVFSDVKTITVTVGKQGDTAVSGTDYTAVTDFTITIAAGQRSGQSAFTLTPIDDALTEGSETLSITGAAVGLTVTATSVTITDDEQPEPVSVRLAATDVEADRRDETDKAELTLTLDRELAVGETLSVPLIFTNGVVPSTQQSKCPASPDPNKPCLSILPLVHVPGAKPPWIDYAIITEGESATLTVTSNPAPASDLTVHLTVIDARGVYGESFLKPDEEGGKTIAKTIVIKAGSTTETVTFETVDDDIDEAYGFLLVRIEPSPDYVAIDHWEYPDGTGTNQLQTAPVIVHDNDVTTLKLTTPDTTATEGDADDTARIVLTLNRGLTGIPKYERLEIPLFFSGGVLGEDFTLSLDGDPHGVRLYGDRVVFRITDSDTYDRWEAPTAREATLLLTALPDSDTASKVVTVDIPTGAVTKVPLWKPEWYTLSPVHIIETGMYGGVTGSRTGDGRITLSDAGALPETAEPPLEKYEALVERIKIDMQSPNYGGEAHDLKRVLKTLVHPDYVNYNGGTVSVQEATNRRTKPSDNPHWEGIAEAIQYKLDYDAGKLTQTPVTDDDNPPQQQGQQVTPQGQQRMTAEDSTVPVANQDGLDTDFTLTLTGAPAGVTLTGSMVTFTGPSAGLATVELTAMEDPDAQDELLRVSIPTSNTAVDGVRTRSNTEQDPVPLLIAQGIPGGVMGSGAAQIRIANQDGPCPSPDPNQPCLSILPLVHVPGAKPPWIDYAIITEGESATLTVTSNPAPTSPLTVQLKVVDARGVYGESFLTGDQGGLKTMVIPAGATTETFTFHTTDDDVDETSGQLLVSIEPSPDYFAIDHWEYPEGTGTNQLQTVPVIVHDNDVTTLKLTTPDTTATEGDADDTARIVLTLNRGLASIPKFERLEIPLFFSGGVLGQDFTLSLDGDPHGVRLNGDRVVFQITDSDIYKRPCPPRPCWEAPTSKQVTLLLTALPDSDTDNKVVTVDIPTESVRRHVLWHPDEVKLSPFHIDATGMYGGVTGSRTGDGRITLRDAGDDTPDPQETADHPLVKYATLIQRIKTDMQSPNYQGEAHDLKRALKTLGDPDYVNYDGGTVSVQEATNRRTKPRDNPHWEGIADAIQYKLDYDAAATPEITISGGSGVTEGGTATFTVSASPVPASAITVNIGVSESGDWGATGAATVSVSAATTTYTIATSDDQADEADGSVTATVKAGTGYTIGTASTATVTVADDDVPEITISGGSGITEGGTASFTISASPAPASAITVNVGVSETGDWGATGAATVSVNSATTTYTIATTNDQVDEANGSVTATVQSGAGYTVGSASTATVAVADDDPALESSVTISIEDASASESASDLVFRVTLSEASHEDITVQWRTLASNDPDRRARAGEDYWDMSGEIRISAGETSGTGAVWLYQDSEDEPDELFTVYLHSPVGATIAREEGTMTIIDAVDAADSPAPATPEITISGGSGIAEGGTASFAISASPAPASPITVNVGVSQTGDFGATGAATVSVSGASTSYTITTSDDNVDEADGSVTATVQSGTGYTVGTASTATVAVSDDDVPEITISGGSGITEGGTASFTISANPVPASAITVNIGVSEAGDFGASGPATVSVSGASATYTVSTINDQADEADGSVTATVQAGSGYTVGATSTATVTVADDDPAPEPQEETPEPPLEKYATLVQSFYDRITANAQHGDDASGGWNKRFLKAMGHPEYVNYPQAAATVQDARDRWQNGANTSWDGTVEAIQYKLDYDAGTVNPPATSDPEITISGGAGITEGGTASFTITASPAPASPITVNIGVSQSGSWGATGAATVSVNSATTTYTIATGDDQVDEADGSVTATVKAGTGYTVGTASTATVTVADDDVPEITISGGSGITEGGTASFTISASPAPTSAITVNIGVSQTGDFGATGAATVSVNSATTTYTIATSDDQVDEADGSVTATVQSGNGYTVGATSTATVAVSDDDVPPPATPEITISGGSGITEGGSATFTISASPAPASAITVNIGVSETGDWDATGAATVSVNSATTTYTIATSDDQVDEADGSVTATVKAGTGYTIGTASTATVTVADDDVPEITISGGSGITEGGSATFTISASPVPASAITVNIGVSQTGDFGATGAATVSVNSATTTYTIATSDDQVDEANGSVTATVQSGNGYTVGTASTATVTVADDDEPPTPATPEITISGGSGITEGGSASFTISASPVPASAITVNIGVSESGSWDATGAATVSVNSATTTYTIATSDDQVDEADGSVTATVQSGTGYTVGPASTATVTVADDDVPEITISGGSGITEGGSATFTISASPVPASAITVNIGVSQSGDFGATGAATVSVNSATTTYTIATSDDNVDEADGSVTATVQSGSGYTVGAASTATVAVADDDDAPPPAAEITISIEDASAPESASDLVFRVTLSEASDEDITVQWRTLASNDPDRRARGGQDYWDMGGEIRIGAGETSGTGAVWLNQDSQDEPDELFTVYLHSPSGATLDREEATMTIIDDD